MPQLNHLGLKFFMEFRFGVLPIKSNTLIVDNFFKRAFRYGYTSKNYVLSEIIRERRRIVERNQDTAHSVHDLLPPREREYSESEN